MKTLDNQKQIAKEVLHLLEAADPNCILAGGAPRDWWFGNIARDLDFYVYFGENTTCGEDKIRFKRLGLNVDKMSSNKHSLEYGSIPELHRVFEGNFKGETIQIMVMNKPTFGCVVDRFGCSVSKVWWKGSNIRPTLQFLVSHVMKVNFLEENYNSKETYVKKMSEKYPEYVSTDKASYKGYEKLFKKFYKDMPLWRLFYQGEDQSYTNTLRILGL